MIKFKKKQEKKKFDRTNTHFYYIFLVRNLDRELEGLKHEIHILFLKKNKVNIIQRKEESICVKEL